MLNECDELSFWAVSEKENVNCRLHINSYCKVEYCLFSSDVSWDTIVLYTWDVWHLQRVSVLQLHEAWAFVFIPSFLYFYVSGLFSVLSQRQLALCAIIWAHILHKITHRLHLYQTIFSLLKQIFTYALLLHLIFCGVSLLLRTCWSSRVFLSVSLVPSSVFRVGYYSAHSHFFLHCNF